MNVQQTAEPEQSVHRLPNEPVETPCFLIYEDAVRHNLRRTAEAAGGIDRLMPHVKTHRAPWIVKLLLEQGVTAFKCATLAEVEMVLENGGLSVTWAYPTVNAATLMRFVDLAKRFPDAQLIGLVDSERGISAWRETLRGAPGFLTRCSMKAQLYFSAFPPNGRSSSRTREESAAGMPIHRDEVTLRANVTFSTKDDIPS